MDLVAFLLARLDEDARDSRIPQGNRYSGGWHRDGCDFFSYDPTGCDCGLPDRVLAEVRTKRQIVALHEPPCDVCLTGEWVPIDGVDTPKMHGAEPCRTLRLLAQPFASHPDYQQEWAPELPA